MIRTLTILWCEPSGIGKALPYGVKLCLNTLTGFVIIYGMPTEKDLEEAQRKKEYGYWNPSPDDYNEVYDDDGYIEEYPEEE